MGQGPRELGLPKDFRFYDLRHTGHTLPTQSVVRAGQSSEKAAMIYQHSEDERQQEVAGGIDARVRAARQRGPLSLCPTVFPRYVEGFPPSPSQARTPRRAGRAVVMCGASIGVCELARRGCPWLLWTVSWRGAPDPERVTAWSCG